MRLQSILLVIIFVACIVLTLYVFTFGSVINDFIVQIGLVKVYRLFNWFFYVFSKCLRYVCFFDYTKYVLC